MTWGNCSPPSNLCLNSTFIPFCPIRNPNCQHNFLMNIQWSVDARHIVINKTKSLQCKRGFVLQERWRVHKLKALGSTVSEQFCSINNRPSGYPLKIAGNRHNEENYWPFKTPLCFFTDLRVTVLLHWHYAVKSWDTVSNWFNTSHSCCCCDWIRLLWLVTPKSPQVCSAPSTL